MLRVRHNTYHIDIHRPDGKRLRKATGIKVGERGGKKRAQELHDKIKNDLWGQAKLGDRPEYLWENAVVRWLEEHQHKKSLDKDIARLKILDQWLRGKRLAEIDRELVALIKRERSQQYKTQSRGKGRPPIITDQLVTPAEVNRMLSVLRSVLNEAEEWDWISKAPKVKLYTETEGVARWLHYDQAEKLLEKLPQPLSDMAALTLEIGLREQNIARMRVSEVDLRARLIHCVIKGGYPFACTLNDAAIEIIQRNMVVVSNNEEDWLFPNPDTGLPYVRLNNTSWATALRAANIKKFRWHDLRHTWASWHVQCGTDLYTLQQLGGWRSIQMVQRYAHLAPKNLEAAQAALKSRSRFRHADD